MSSGLRRFLIWTNRKKTNSRGWQCCNTWTKWIWMREASTRYLKFKAKNCKLRRILIKTIATSCNKWRVITTPNPSEYNVLENLPMKTLSTSSRELIVSQSTFTLIKKRHKNSTDQQCTLSCWRLPRKERHRSFLKIWSRREKLNAIIWSSSKLRNKFLRSTSPFSQSLSALNKIIKGLLSIRFLLNIS